MPELIEPGVNGALVDSVDQAVAAVEALGALDRAAGGRSFEQRFTAARMAENYGRVYQELVAERVASQGTTELPAGISTSVPALPVAEERQPSAWVDHIGADGSRPR